jgi:hypothetical protein
MTRMHHPSRGEADDETFEPPRRWVTPPAPASSVAARSPVGPAVIADSVAGLEIGDVGAMTVSELAAAAELLRVSPSSLLGARPQARLRADLDLAAHLPPQVTDLVLEFAQLHPGTAAVLASMIDRYTTTDRTRAID